MPAGKGQRRRATPVCTPVLMKRAMPGRLVPPLLQMSPLGDRLLVKPQEVENKTAGGILLAPTSSGRSMQDALVGTGEPLERAERGGIPR